MAVQPAGGVTPTFWAWVTAASSRSPETTPAGRVMVMVVPPPLVPATTALKVGSMMSGNDGS